mmetsp:Transcript_10344/g.31126  ORF Transcript_10344/g.31126 Transcript_10344/m.31126 type:complete len:234 (-) Transcript_10344:3002-3703(-)
MAQQQALAYLQQAKDYARKHIKDLEEAERQLRGADDGAAEAIMAGETARAMSFHDQEIAALEAYASGKPIRRRGALSGPAAAIGAAAAAAAAGGGGCNGVHGAPSREAPLPAISTPKPKVDMEARLLAMGAVPALGGLMKTASGNNRSMLTATGSPAAREVFYRAHGGESDGQATLRPTNNDNQPSSPSSWQEELRARRLNPTPSRAARAPTAADTAVNDELAAMFAKRQIGA